MGEQRRNHNFDQSHHRTKSRGLQPARSNPNPQRQSQPGGRPAHRPTSAKMQKINDGFLPKADWANRTLENPLSDGNTPGYARLRTDANWTPHSFASNPIGPTTRATLQPQLVAQVGQATGFGDALLRSIVAAADRDGVVLLGLAVDGEAERRTGFVHPRVPLTDRLLGVVLRRELLFDRPEDRLGDLRQSVLGHQGETPPP
jgi:hypothetical protein